jgi:hypothetical protein
MFPPSYFDHLSDRLALAVYDTNQAHRVNKLEQIKAVLPIGSEVSYSEGALYITLRGKAYRFGELTTADDVNAWLWNQREPRMSAIEKLKAKALYAKTIVHDAIKGVEDGLDGIIAHKAPLEQKTAEAMAPHLEAIAGLHSELDGIKGALDILSNGGPPLEPSTPEQPK